MPHSTDSFMTEPEAIKLLEAHGIPYPKHAMARSPEAAVAFADTHGYPVVLKIVSPQVSHKSDVGGVEVNLKDADAVRAAYAKIEHSVKAACPSAVLEGMLVCAQANPGVEVIIGGVEDPVLGPTLMFGLGGIFTELLKDVSFRSIPLTRLDAEEMLCEIKGTPMLTGARGTAPCDMTALAYLLMAVSGLLEAHPECKELDLNPVRVYPQGLLALDVRILTSNAKEQDHA